MGNVIFNEEKQLKDFDMSNEYTNDMIDACEDFDSLSDFYSDTEDLIIRRFNDLNKKFNKEESQKMNDELKKGFGDFLVNTGNEYIKLTENQD